MTGESTRVRLASIKDVNDLVRLENTAFVHDRFSKEQIEYLLTEAHATTFVAEVEGKVAGGACMLWRTSYHGGRLYNIAVDPQMHGFGLGNLLIHECEAEAARRGCRKVTLEVREDNHGAIGFYEHKGYRLHRRILDYYHDGSPALQMVKDVSLGEFGEIRFKVPYTHQSLDFTCGPASLMMAFKYHDPEVVFSRSLECTLWREATLIFMTSGIGGSDPFGLAMAAFRRGFQTRIILSQQETPFYLSVRKPGKRTVIKMVHNDLKKKAMDAGIPTSFHKITSHDLISAMHRGMIPVVLTSTYHLTGDRAPHWIALTGFSGDTVYFHDPDIESYKDNSNNARNIALSWSYFDQMQKYGKNKDQCAIFVGPRNRKRWIHMDGSDL